MIRSCSSSHLGHSCNLNGGHAGPHQAWWGRMEDSKGRPFAPSDEWTDENLLAEAAAPEVEAPDIETMWAAVGLDPKKVVR